MEKGHSNAYFSHDNVRTWNCKKRDGNKEKESLTFNIQEKTLTVHLKAWHHLCRAKLTRGDKQLPAPSPFGYNMGTILYPNS